MGVVCGGGGRLVNPPQDLYGYVLSNRVMIMRLLITKGVFLIEAFLEWGVILEVLQKILAIILTYS